jgi:hypothetical protein
MESDLETVARAYLTVHETGAKDYPAFVAAMRAFAPSIPVPPSIQELTAAPS